MTYELFDRESAEPKKGKIQNCSDQTFYCLSGPFLFRVKKDELLKLRSRAGTANWETEDPEKVCSFQLIVDPSGNIGIERFHCKYRNMMPWPAFVAQGKPAIIPRLL